VALRDCPAFGSNPNNPILAAIVSAGPDGIGIPFDGLPASGGYGCDDVYVTLY